MGTSFVGPAELQLLLTLVLFVFSWTLNRTLREGAFFRWWTWGWAAFAFALLIFRLTVPDGGADGSTRVLEFLGSQGGFLQVTLFAFGAFHLHRGRPPSRRALATALTFTVTLAIVVDVTLPPLSSNILLSVAGRVVLRSLGMAVVFPLCGILLLHRRPGRADPATLVTAGSFMLYGANQAVYGGLALWGIVSGLDPSGSAFASWYTSPWAFAWDMVWEAGIGVGYYLLLTTEHRRTYEALLESEARFRSAFSHAPIGMALVGSDDVVLSANQALGRLLRVSPDRLTGRHLASWIHPADHSALPRRSAPSDSGQQHTPIRLVDAEGEIRQVLVQLAPIGDNGGEKRMIVQTLDVTEWVKLESELRRSEKREATGRMAAALAHNFNNLLTSIVIPIEMALEDSPPEMTWYESLVEARSSTLEAAKLTHKMLEYLGSLAAAHGAVDVGQLIQDRSAALRSALPAGADLKIAACPTLPMAAGDAELIASALQILVTNAADALVDHKGSVEIQAGWQSGVPASAAVNYLPDDLPGGGLVSLTVKDDGTGIPPEIQDKIFDPFFSTRFLGRGLGLSSLLGIVRTHDGAVCVDTTVGKGTVFTILLPAFQGAEGPRASESA